MPFEVSRSFKVNVKKEILDSEENIMSGLWIDFCRKNNLDQEFSDLGDHAVSSRWTEYAHSNYKKPEPAEEEKVWS